MDLTKTEDLYATLLLPIVLLIVLGVFGEVLAEELYRWVDDRGIISFTDNLQSVPAKYRRDAEKRFFAPSREMPAPTPQNGLQRSTESTPTPPGVPFIQVGREIIVEGFINHRGPVQLIVDQGATITTLPASVAAQLGINLKNSLPLRLEGIRGLLSGHLVTIDSLRLGDAEIEGLDIAISERVSSANGFLGRDFLGLFRVHMDFRLKRMELMRGEGAYDGLSPEWWQEKFRFYRGLKQTYEKHIKQSNETFNKLQYLGPFEYEGDLAARLQQIRNEINTYGSYVRIMTQKIDDLDRRAGYAAVPRELRE